MMRATSSSSTSEVAGGEPGGVPAREGGEDRGPADDQPHLVAVPERADAVDRDPSLVVGPGETRCSAPTPKSKPSSTKKPVQSTAISTNHRSCEAHDVDPLVGERRDGRSPLGGSASSCSGSSPRRRVAQHQERRRRSRARRRATRNTARLMATSVVLTDGETPSLVVISPCTSQGCRPFSVSSQPAVFIANGASTAQVATTRKTPGRGQSSAPGQPAAPQAEERQQRAEVGHHPHRPVLDEDVRHVVAGAVLLLRTGPAAR